MVLIDWLGNSAERLKAVVPRHISKGALGRSVALHQAGNQSPQLLADDRGGRVVEATAVVSGLQDLARLQLSPGEQAVEPGRAAGQVVPEDLQPRRGIFAVVSILDVK